MTSGEVATQSPRLRAGAAFLLGMGGDGGRTGPAGMEGMMFAKRALALAPLAMLAACATNYPDLVSTRPPPPAVPPQNAELDETLVDAANLQKSYAIGYKQSAQNQDLSALPIIGAAAAAAFVLLANKTNAATTAGNIGIGGGAYAALRGQLSPAGLADAYISGHGALTCVLAEGSYFSGENAKALYKRQDNELQDLEDYIARVDQTEHDPLFNTVLTQQQSDNLKTAISVAGQAVSQARTAETAALAQKAAFDNAAPVFRNAVASISVRVASKGRVRPAVDFGALRDSFAPPKTGSAVKAQGASTVDLAIAAVTAATVGLVTETAKMTAATRPYSQSLTRVGACPDQIK